MSMQALLDACPQAPDFQWNWSAIRNTAAGALLNRMSATPQNSRWHGEGDVETHTRMVCEALANDPAYRALSNRKRQILAIAALLHDVGKIPNTRLEDGQWTSPHHGSTGMHMAREMLWKDFGLCGAPDKQAFRETVCLLIRNHMLPGRILDQSEPERRLMKLAADGRLCGDFSIEMLCLLAEADMRGRIAGDIPEMLDKVALCRQEAEACGCLNGPGAFADDYTQRAYFKGRSVWRGQSLYDDTWGEVVLMAGLPGTGKDTWIRANCGALPVVSLDALRRELRISPTDAQGRVAQAAQEQARKCLRAKQPFVWNATNLTEATRGKLISLFESYGASVRVVYLETEWTENLRRNGDREAVVPEKVIEDMLGKLAPPQSWEAGQVEWICV